MEKAGDGERNASYVLVSCDCDMVFGKMGVGEKHGESGAERDIEELNDWSTSIGSSDSVPVGDGTGEEKRVEGKDSIRGDEENMSIMSIGRVDGHEVGDNARLLRWRYRQDLNEFVISVGRAMRRIAVWGSSVKRRETGRSASCATCISSGGDTVSLLEGECGMRRYSR